MSETKDAEICSTCRGVGKIDQSLTSDARAGWAPCPDCDGADECAESAAPDPRDAEIATLRAEVERLKAAAFAPSGDNHHNAMLCPYCNPARALAPKP